MTKLIKKPAEGLVMAMNIMAAEVELIKTGEASFRKDVFNDEIEGVVVNTVIGFDTHIWETGINQDGSNWTIVEQYLDKDHAERGHKQWVEFITENPQHELEDIFGW